jgi:DNA invertase Pin-like site-specific DNA recombinase
MLSHDGFKYIIYARKSTESEDRQITSIEDQLEVLEEYAKRQNLEIVDTISESKSAKIPYKRDGFDALIDRIRNGEADGIIC